ncbi:MAG: peptidoglycan -binding protein [Gammaproteobacteria bacterium]
MSTLRRRRGIDIWPAFVDAMASLLMVVVFVLLVAVVGQQFLTGAILGRDQALARLNTRVDELADLLALSEAEGRQLQDELRLRTASLEAARKQTAEQRGQLDQQHSALVEQETIIDRQTQRLGTLESEIAALAALKERLERDIGDIVAERDDIRARLDQQQNLNVTAQAQIEFLNRQLAEVRKQLSSLAVALDAAAAEVAQKQERIDELGARLNLALASEAARLQRYRSEFFGRLREALADVPGIAIEGDRFVLPSGLLFASASDELGPGGRRQIAELAATLEALRERIPPDLDWVLRIDGHTDRRPISTARFPSNWELSSARAISIVRELIRLGVPPQRLAATGFADNHPIVAGDEPADLARNRRIEIKLTSR